MKRTKKYTTKIGQYTGTSNASKNEQNSAITVARVADNLPCSQPHAHGPGQSAASNRQRHHEYNAPKLPLRQPPDERPEFVIPL